MAAKDPTLADALRMIAAQGRQIDALLGRVKELEAKLAPKPRRPGGVPNDTWLAQRRELAKNARKHRWPAGPTKKKRKKAHV